MKRRIKGSLLILELLFLLSLFTTISLVERIPAAKAQNNTYYINGTSEVWENQEITLTYVVNITNGGSLTIRNCTIYVGWNKTIAVFSGSLYVYDSTIISSLRAEDAIIAVYLPEDIHPTIMGYLEQNIIQIENTIFKNATVLSYSPITYIYNCSFQGEGSLAYLLTVSEIKECRFFESHGFFISSPLMRDIIGNECLCAICQCPEISNLIIDNTSLIYVQATNCTNVTIRWGNSTFWERIQEKEYLYYLSPGYSLFFIEVANGSNIYFEGGICAFNIPENKTILRNITLRKAELYFDGNISELELENVTLNGKPVLLLKNKNNVTVENVPILLAYNCTYIKGRNIGHGGQGLFLQSVKDSIFENISGGIKRILSTGTFEDDAEQRLSGITILDCDNITLRKISLISVDNEWDRSYGIFLNRSNHIDIAYCTVEGWSYDIFASYSPIGNSFKITYSEIKSTNRTDVLFFLRFTTATEIHQCNILPGINTTIIDAQNSHINATYCYWGSPDGPNLSRCVIENSEFYYEPWLTEPVQILIPINILEITGFASYVNETLEYDEIHVLPGGYLNVSHCLIHALNFHVVPNGTVFGYLCVFRNMTLFNLTGLAYLRDCLIENVALFYISVPNPYFLNVTFRNTTVILENARNVTFQNCRFENARLVLNSSQGCSFENCNFVGFSPLILGTSTRHFEHKFENVVVNGKPLVYLTEEKDKIIREAGSIILVNCRNITIYNFALPKNATVLIEAFRSRVHCRLMKIRGSDYGIVGINAFIHLDRCEITNNERGIYLINSTLVISYSNIYNNRGAGINATNSVISAKFCYWGSPKGPEINRDADAASEEIYATNSEITYSPWLAEPAPLLEIQPPPPVIATIAVFEIPAMFLAVPLIVAGAVAAARFIKEKLEKMEPHQRRMLALGVALIMELGGIATCIFNIIIGIIMIVLGFLIAVFLGKEESEEW